MPYIIALAASLLILIGFMSLTYLETTKGFRIMGGVRRRLDRRVGQAAFIAQHVDLGAFVRDTLRQSAERVVHDVAHAFLVLVRLIERMLTRFVRQLRGREQEARSEPRQTLGERIRHMKSMLRLRRLTIKEKEESDS